MGKSGRSVDWIGNLGGQRDDVVSMIMPNSDNSVYCRPENLEK
jgi:hypothetical protein